MSARIGWLVLALCLTTGPAPAARTPQSQGPPQKPQAPTFRSTVDLIQVDAVAVDADGRHVRGLTAADFTLLDRGKPVEIATFDEVEHERVPPAEAARAAEVGPAIADVASNQAVADDRLVVMVVDDLHIYRRRTDQTRKIARDVVGKLGPGASMAVLFTSGDRSTEITRNRRALTDVIDGLEARRPFPRPAMSTTAREAGRPEVAANGDYSLQNYYEQVETIRTLRDASRLLKTGDTARKAFVLISEWMPKDLSGLYQAGAPPGAVEGGEAYAAGNLEASSIPSDTGALDYEFIDMMDAMRRSNVVTYAIDPRGEVSPQELMRECHPSPPNGDRCLGDAEVAGGPGPSDWTSWVRQSQHGLEFTSEASGGFAITNTDDFTGGLDRIVEDLDHYYLLGFYPSDPGKRGFRRLDLRVNRPGVSVRFRHGYEVGPAREAKPKNDDPLVELAAGVIEKRTLPIRLTAMPMPNPGVGAEANPIAMSREVRVDVAIEISSPVERLVQADGRVADSVRYTVLAANLKDGKVAKQFTNTAEVTSPAPIQARPGAMVSYQLPVELMLLPGRYQIRAAAMSDAIGDGGSVYLTLDVPDYRRASVAMSALVLGYADGRRRPVTTGGAAKSALPFTPTLDREFRTGERLRVYFEIASSRAVGRITLDVIDAGGRTALSQQPPVPTDTRMAIGLPLTLQGLAPGEYTLRATAVGPSGRGSRELTFRIR